MLNKRKLISYLLDCLIIGLFTNIFLNYIIFLIKKIFSISYNIELAIISVYGLGVGIYLFYIFKKEKTIGKYIAKKIIKDENKKFTLKEIIIIIIIINGYFLFEHFFLKWRSKKIEKVQKINENAPKDNHNFKNILKKNAKTVKKKK